MKSVARKILKKIREHDPQPNVERLHTTLSRSRIPDRVPFMELFADNEVMATILGKRLNYFDKKLRSRRQWEERMFALIEFHEMLGYDYVRADTRDYETTVKQSERDEEL